MLTILNEKQVKEFIEEVNSAYSECEYYEHLKYNKKNKYLGWVVDNSVECFLEVKESRNEGKREFLKSIDGEIIDLVSKPGSNYARELFAKTAKEFPNIALQLSDYISYNDYKDSYNHLIVKSPYSSEDYNNKIYIEIELYISIYNKVDFQKELEKSLNTEIGDLEYKIMSKEELKNILLKDGEWKNHLVGDNANFLGFHYFNARELVSYFESPKNLEFVVCISNDEVLGVLKIADYNSYGLTYKGLNYVDVHVKHRRKGIAKGLYKTLNEHLSEDDILISSIPSKMGKEIKINLVRKKYLTVKNYDDMNDYYNSLK